MDQFHEPDPATYIISIHVPGMDVYKSKAGPSNHNMNKTAFDLLSNFFSQKKNFAFNINYIKVILRLSRLI